MDPKFLNFFDSESSTGCSENNSVVAKVTAAPPPPPPERNLLEHQFQPSLQNQISLFPPLRRTHHHNPAMFPTNTLTNTFRPNGFANYHPYMRPQEFELFPSSPEGPRTMDLISLIDNQPRRIGDAAKGADRAGWGATIGLDFIDDNLDLKL